MCNDISGDLLGPPACFRFTTKRAATILKHPPLPLSTLKSEDNDHGITRSKARG